MLKYKSVSLYRLLQMSVCGVAAISMVLALSPRDAIAASGKHAMVTAESAPAAAAGAEILKEGGNAIDGAVATALAEGVTNPGSCGLGGGGFMLIYIAKTHKAYALDFRERAPLAASATMYFRDGKADEKLALNGPLAVGVPGQVYGLATALHRFGTMKFQQVAAPAIKLASDGMKLSPMVAHEIAATSPRFDDQLKAVFLPGGKAPKAGTTVVQKNLAALLKHLGNDPIKVYYHGEVARQIADYVKSRGGLLTTKDLSSYRSLWRTPLERGFKGLQVYTMPPPSSGGVVLEMLGMLEPDNLAGMGLNSAPYLARLIEVERQGFFDRNEYGDPAFIHVPIKHLLSAEHIAHLRERALHHERSMKVPAAHDHGTSNLCVMDRMGNVVVLTATINTAFGSKLMVPKLGMVLNNEMDDFAVAPGVPNVYRLRGVKRNEIAPGKRPLSSMSPTIVLKDGHPVLALGGSGGPTIITGVLQVALNVLDFHLDPVKAVDEPRIHEQAAPVTVLVEAAIPSSTRDALKKMGYKLHVVPHLGAVNAIEASGGKLLGASDPRKSGGAVGY